MIEGAVNAAYQPIVTLSLMGPKGEHREVDAVVDTGFNRFLTLPPSVVADLGLRKQASGELMLADGSRAKFDIFGVAVDWICGERCVEVHEADGLPLLGMALMDGYRLSVVVRTGGRVLIEA